MDKKVEQIQLMYEVAMSIGTSLDLQKMLKNFLTRVLKKLNCSVGGVFQIQQLADDKLAFTPVCTIPRKSDTNPSYQKALGTFNELKSLRNWQEFRDQLPLKGTLNSGEYHILEIHDFGVLMLIKNGSPIDLPILKSLNVICNKLSEACIACLQQLQIQEVNNSLREKTQELEKSRYALEVSEKKYRQIFENIQDVFYQTDYKGTIIEISPSIEGYSGYTREELIGKEISQYYYYPEDYSRLWEAMEKNQKVQDFEVRLRRRNGTMIFTSVNASIVFDTSNNGFYTEGTLRDISDRKAVEKKVLLDKESQQVINYFATSLLGSNTTEQILWDIAENCISHLGFEDCVVYLFNEERTALIQKAAYGPGKVKGNEILNAIEIPVGKGIVGGVAESGKAEIVSDVSIDKRYIIDDDSRSSEMAVPIIYENEVIGVIDSEHSEKYFYSDHHLKILETIASLAANKIMRVQAEEKQRESQEKYSKLFQQSHDAIILHDMAGNILDVNQQAIIQFGYDAAEMRHLNIAQLHLPEVQEVLQFAFQKMTEEGTFNFEIEFLRKDGSHFTGEVATSQFEVGKSMIVQVVIRDVTVRRQTEAAIRESEARKSAIMQSALDCIITIDHEGIILEFNPAAEEIFQYKASEIIGKKLSETIIPHQYRDAHESGMVHYMATGEGPVLGQRIEITALRADGSEFPIELAITPIELNEYPFFTAYLRDITDKKAAELALQEGKERLDAILQNIGEGVLVIDQHQEIILINGRARELLGIEKLSLQKLLLENALMNCKDKGKDLLAALADDNFTKLELIVDYPQTRVLAITGTSFVLDIDVAFGGKVFILWDVTREREIDRMKTDFVSSVSHELRTPLASILGFSSTILRDPEMDEETRNEFVGIIQEESKRLSRLIEDLLSISRIESGKVHYELKTMKFAPLLQEVYDTYKLQAAEKEITLNYRFEEDCAVINADRDAIKRVLVNLIGNAIKFSNTHSTVSLKLYEENGENVVEIQDKGLGIPKKDLDKIFDKFYRVNRPGTQIKGTGLGLSIVKEIIDMHRGKIDVESEPGKGSLFRITIPNAL